MFYVYIITNKPKGVMYIGVTNDLARRIYEHRAKIVEGFSKKYGLNKLVYIESYNNSLEAISREKQLKNWHRNWKINLIESINPHWEDLYESVI
ncbi:MAG: nuclease [Rickettsiaceae bacterium]|jgi:putative endonuclease|nr:nuclease [Rickettsiaceae bacterium]